MNVSQFGDTALLRVVKRIYFNFIFLSSNAHRQLKKSWKSHLKIKCMQFIKKSVDWTYGNRHRWPNPWRPWKNPQRKRRISRRRGPGKDPSDKSRVHGGAERSSCAAPLDWGIFQWGTRRDTPTAFVSYAWKTACFECAFQWTQKNSLFSRKKTKKNEKKMRKKMRKKMIQSFCSSNHGIKNNDFCSALHCGILTASTPIIHGA